MTLDIKNSTLKKLTYFVKAGHVASRDFARYIYATMLANCIEHSCFNLSNGQLLQNFSFTEIKEYFGGFDEKTKEDMKTKIFNSITQTGLKIKKCQPQEILKYNEWKVALYFGKIKNTDEYDAHFLKEEENGAWSEKMGFEKDVSFYGSLLKTIYPCYQKYELENVYKITNPYAITEPEHELIK